MSTTLDRPVASDQPDHTVVLTVDERPLRRRLGPGPRRRFAGAVGPVLLLAAWALGSWSGFLDPQTLSAPWTVLESAKHLIDEGRLQSNLEMSAKRAMLGLLLGVSVGVVLALLAGLSRLGEAVIDGPVQIKRAIPALAILPLLILWLGIGEEMKVITIALGVFVPIYLQTHAGLRAIESKYVELAQTVDLGRWAFLRRVVIPGALPHFLLGLRFAGPPAWRAPLGGEQGNAPPGPGPLVGL